MNASDILMWGDRWFCDTLSRVPLFEWETPNVCGVWSVKNIVAHITSFEYLLEDVLNSFLGQSSTPTLAGYLKIGGQGFNDTEVPKRQQMSAADTLAEYNAHQARTMELIARIQKETRERPGTLPWYGMEYALDDFLVYQYYGHKREHGAQVNVFADTLKQ